jgi:exodeoxyribonuclease III
MRIVVWNCRMGFGKKRELLYALKPDIAVIPECSQDAVNLCNGDGYSGCWWGDKKHKGLAVIAAKQWTVEVGRPPTQKWIAPVKVRGATDFLLLAVWACPVGQVKELNYIGQVFEAIKRHNGWFSDGLPTVICGDFNSNAIFDRGRKRRTHSEVVAILKERNLSSAYHAFFSEEHGKETKPTYYFWHWKSRPFHIDYVFLPSKWIPSVKVTVGTYRKWRSLSDHVPLIVDLSPRA